MSEERLINNDLYPIRTEQRKAELDENEPPVIDLSLDMWKKIINPIPLDNNI